jgi:hypothetical protein
MEDRAALEQIAQTLDPVATMPAESGKSAKELEK